ncbi:RdRP-domain-containing protein [Mycena sp. CBHHK59/15]|nr:RdRP-domain-containing protein [Mycena sp. CBHHK59/15]
MTETLDPPAIEVHLKDISFSTKHHQVVTELAKILHSPRYARFSAVPLNFVVYLFKDNRGNKPHSGSGSLTLFQNAALQFLEEYGERSDGRPPLNILKIGGMRVKFSVGRKKPRPEVVERIQRFPFVDPAVAEKKERRTRVLHSQSIPIGALQFGWRCRDSVLSVEWEQNVDGSLSFNDDKRQIRISFARSTETLFVAVRFSQIASALLDISTKDPVIYLELYEPPIFESWTGTGLRQRLSCLPLSDHERVAPFTSTAIRVICTSPDDLNRFRQLGRTAGIHNIYTSELYVERRGLFSANVLKKLQDHLKVLRWSVAFQVEALLRCGALDATEVLAIIPDIRLMVVSKGRSYTTSFTRDFGNKVLHWNEFDGDKPQTIQEFMADVEAEFAKSSAKMQSSLQSTDKSLFQSLHVTISPTAIFLYGPFRSNRVIRSFPSSKHDCFLRVSFADEGKLQYRWDREIDCVAFTRRRVGEFLIQKGLTIAGRNFQFLAYSQSALKEHAVWFVRPFLGQNRRYIDAPTIIKSLGSFDNLEFDPKLTYCPARYAARISLAFTATDSTSIEVEEIIHLPDISAPSGKYHFTDGVGTMSQELAEAIWDELTRKTSRRRNRRVQDHPRAYQIRFQGSKGMLSVDYRLKGHVFCLRPSMIKFSAPQSQTIEIARAFDRPASYFLNRPLVMLLENLGVKYEVFKEYQDKAVQEVQESTRSLATFASMLESHGLGTSYRLTSVLLGLDKLYIDTLSNNNFYQKMLDYAVHHVLRLLKTKAKIPIPGAVTVVGVADVHQYLREGEIFVCTRSSDTNQLHYLKGDVLISRSPTIHPGDVQLVKAIGKPPPGSCFAHEPLPNTVVFSVLGKNLFPGKRPLPSCCGGGDLDGDTYNIIPLNKCPGFYPAVTHKPGEYSPAPKKLLETPSTMKDVAEFVIEYINSDAIGIIAINWLIIADQSPSGILDPDCMKLASLHSDAVDYPKSGQPVAMNTIPKPKTSLKPDWHAPEVNVDMGTRPSALSSYTAVDLLRIVADYYPSQRAIGKLFRAIKLPEIQTRTLSTFDRRMIKEGRKSAPSIDDLADTLDGFSVNDNPIAMAIEERVAEFIETDLAPQDTVEYIAQIFSRYASALQGICAAHTLSLARTAFLSEEEAVIGTIIAKTSQPRKRSDLISSLREKTDQLVRDVKEELWGDDDVTSEECLQRAWLSFEFAIAERKSFGAQSFIWIAMGAIFDGIKEIEEADKGSRRR